MSILRLLLAVSLIVLSLFVGGYAQQIPAGTVLPIMASTTLDSSKDKPGTRVTGRLMQDVVLAAGRIRAGARIEGTVTEVSAATASSPARLQLRFDKLSADKRQYALSVAVRAIASMDEVFQAQLPWSTFDDYGTSSSDWNTVQVGGAAVYRGDGTVRSAMEIIGRASDSGDVTAKLMPSPKRGCSAVPAESRREQSLWVFSPWACGTYGFEALTITKDEAAAPVGIIELNAPKSIHIRGGSGWLLVAVTAQADTSPTVAR